MESTALQLNNFNELSSELVTSQTALFSRLWELSQPGIETEQGPLNSLVVTPNGIASAAVITLLDRWRRSTRLAELARSTEDLDSQLLEYLASNYRIERKVGSMSRGQILIEVSKFAPFNIDGTTVFSVSGMNFVLESSFSVKTNPSAVLTSTDRLLFALDESNNRFGVVIEAVSETATAAANIAKNTELSFNLTWPQTIRSYAYSSFTGGGLPESNAELANRVLNGITLPQLSGRANMQAFLYDQFPLTIADSIVGLGDAELSRDKTAIFPVSTGGKADWYIKTQAGLSEVSVGRTAKLQSSSAGGIGTWQITFTNDEYTGLYEVFEVHRAGNNAAPVAIQSKKRFIDIEKNYPNQFIPEINTIEEVAFSAYQGYVVTVTDSVPVQAGETERDFVVSLRYMPKLREIQEAVNDDRNRPVGTDILVRAPIPCFVSMSIVLAVPYNTQLDLNRIRQDVVNYINVSKFKGFLPGSGISTLIQTNLSSDSYIKHFNMIGRVLLPSGDESVIVRDKDALTVDVLPFATARTVGFFTDVARVFIQVDNI